LFGGRANILPGFLLTGRKIATFAFELLLFNNEIGLFAFPFCCLFYWLFPMSDPWFRLKLASELLAFFVAPKMLAEV